MTRVKMRVGQFRKTFRKLGGGAAGWGLEPNCLFENVYGRIISAAILQDFSQSAGCPRNTRVVRRQFALVDVQALTDQALRFFELSLRIAKKPKRY